LPNSPRGRNWHVLNGPLSASELRATLEQIGTARGLHVTYPHPEMATIASDGHGPYKLVVRWHSRVLPVPDAQTHNLTPESHLEVLVAGNGVAPDPALLDDLVLRLRRHSTNELDRLRANMPLVDRYATIALGVEDWALIFRDHYVENTLGFLL